MRMSTRVTRREIVPMLTAKEVAEKMGVDRNEVYRLANRRDGLRAYKVSGRLRFKPEDVEEYM